jgi:hypothetical protein
MNTCPGMRVRVFVNGEQIPTTEVESRFSPHGPASVNRLSEVRYPLEWEGVDYQSKIDAFDPNNQSDYDTASVFWQNVRNSDYVGRHYGFVRGVGGTDTQGVGKLYIEGPSNLVTAIPFSKKYDEPTTTTVLNDVIDEFNANTPFSVGLGSVDRQPIEGAELFDDIIPAVGRDLVEDNGGPLFENTRSAISREMKTSKTFTANEDTLKSVLTWLSEVSGGEWRFSGADPLKIILDTDSSQVTHYTSTGITGKSKTGNRNLKYGGSYRPNGSPAIDVITNDALSELFPLNTITVHGKSPWSVHGIDVSPLTSNRFPAVTVEEPTLVKRANGKNIKGTIQTTGDKTLKAAENSAKKKLKKKITNSGEGEVEAFLAPYIIPGDLLSLVPECSDFVPNANLTPVTFQVNTVRHHKKSTKEGRTYVGVCPVAKRSNMVVTKSKMKEL